MLLTAIACGLLAGFVYFVFIHPRATPLICLHVTDYEAPLPPQAFAQEDLERFTQLFHSSGLSAGQISTGSKKVIEPATATTADDFVDALLQRVRAEKPGGPGNVVLIYLSVQGVVDAEGKPCLVAAAEPRAEKELAQAPIPSETLRRERLIDLKSLLERLQKEHPQSWKVVLLDAVRWERNWRLGMAENHFADGLAPLMASLPPSSGSGGIAIINSCSPGEVGLADPVQERTLFGDYVASGLTGEADASRDGRISLIELAKYLAKRVDAAAQRRGRTQHPLLLLPGKSESKNDFALARTRHSARDARTTEGSMAQRISEFAARWARLPAAASSARGIPAPLVAPLEKTRQEMLRHEALLLGGKAYRGQTEPAIPANWPESAYPPPPAVSLPLSLPAAHDPLESIESNAENWASRFAPPPPDQPDPLEKMRPHERLYGLWSALRQPNTSASRLLPRAGLNQESVLPVELHARIRFHEDNPHLPAKFKPGGAASHLLDRFIDVRLAAERAAYAGGDARVYLWMDAAVKGGDAKRREAEDLAFANADEKVILARLNEAQEAYLAAAKTAGEVAQGFALRDQALANLPYWLEWSSVGDAARVQMGLNLIDSARELELMLDGPGDGGGPNPEMSAAAEKLKQVLADLDQSIDVATKDCIQSSVHLEYLPILDQLLAGPLVDEGQRQQLWDKYFLVRESDLSDAGAGIGQAPRGPAQKLMDRWLEGREASPDQTFNSLATLGRDELLKEEKDFDDADPSLRARLATADRTIRGMTPWLTLVQVRQPFIAVSGEGTAATAGAAQGRHGSVLREECARHDYYHWQAERFLEDFLGNDDGDYRALVATLGGDTLEPYFAAAASRLLDGARQLFPREKRSSADDLFLARRSADAALVRHLSQSLRPASEGPTSPDQLQVTVQPLPADVAAQQAPTGQAALHLKGAQFDRNGAGVAVMIEPPQDVSLTRNDYFSFAVPASPVSGSQPCLLPSPFKFQLPAERPADLGKIASYYRGRAGSIELALDPLKPGHVILAERSSARGKLTVDSSLTEGSVVILLDCSASMKDVDQQWMADAVEAVRTIIGRLLETKKMEVALVLFAHRRGIPKDLERGKINELPWNQTFGGDKETVMFEDDFQMVWKGIAPNAELQWVLGKEANGEDRIQAAGYTPLFSAVEFAALHGFTSNRRGTRHLVIVSDGGDNIPYVQAETKPDWLRSEKYNSDEERNARAAAALKAIDRVGNVDVSLVYLSGLGAGAGPIGQIKERLRIKDDQAFEVRRIAAGAAKLNVQALVNRLSESIGIYAYDVVEESGQVHPGTTAERMEFPIHGRATVEWDRHIHAALEVVADESLLGEIRRAGNQRKFYFLGRDEYERDTAAQRVPLIASEAKTLVDEQLYPREYLVACRAQQPKVGDKHRAFRLAILGNEPGQFSPRPREIWVEIVPRQSAASDQTSTQLPSAEPYFFCQPAFVAESQVPVVELIAPNWPTGAEAASVKVWFRMSDSREVIKLDQSGLKRPNLSGFAGGDYTFGLEFLEDRKQWAIKVVETQPRAADAPSLWSLVTLEGSTADQSERRYFPANGRIEHYFVFRDLQKEALGRRAVNIVPQAVWKPLATSPPQEFTVTIPRN